MAATESHDVDLLDLVSFGHTLRHHGLVIADAKADHDIPVDVFMVLLADNQGRSQVLSKPRAPGC